MDGLDEFHGYKSWNEEALFYQFAVQRYDLSFRYHGRMYYLLAEMDHVAVSDEGFAHEIVPFESGNALIENYLIEGKPLIDIINDLEEVDIF